MFSLRASSAGTRSKEKGWVFPTQLSDRLAKYKNSEGEGLLMAVSVAHSEKKKTEVAQHSWESADILYRELKGFLLQHHNFPQNF